MKPNEQPANRTASPVRVLLIAPSPEIVGGQSVQATALLKTLRQVPELEIDYFPLDQRFPGWLGRVRRVRYLRTVVSSILFTIRLALAARRYRVLHIFTAGLSSYSLWTIPALLLGKSYRMKLVVHYHDGQAEQHLREWRTAKQTLRLADRIVCPSGFLVDVFKKFGIEAQTIFNVIDVSRFHYRARRDLSPHFLSNRGLEPLYNVECTLRAFARIQAVYPEASLVVAHDGVLRKSLEGIAVELGLRNVQFLGTVAHEDVAALYDSIDVYLMSPNIDNMPVSLLECMASGVPIVSTDAGGIPYIVRDRVTALLVAVGDCNALAERALELLANPELAQCLAQAGREEVKRYDADPVCEQWTALYCELTGTSEANHKANEKFYL